MISIVLASFRLLTKKEKTVFVLLTSSRVGLNLLDVAAIILVGLVASALVGGPPLFNFLGWPGLDTSSSLGIITGLSIATVIFLLKSVASAIVAKKSFQFLAEIEARASSSISNRLFKLNLSEMKKYSTAEIEWMLLRSTHLAFTSVLGQLQTLVSEFSLAVFMIVLFFYTDWAITIVAVAYFAIVLLIFSAVTSHVAEKNGDLYTSNSIKFSVALQNLLRAYSEISVLSKGGHFIDVLNKHRKSTAQAQANGFFIDSLPRMIIETSLLIGALVFAMVHLFLLESGTSLATIGIFLLGSVRLMSSFLPLQRAQTALRTLKGQARAAQVFLAGEEVDRDGCDLVSATPGSFVDSSEPLSIEVRNVSFEFQDSGARGVAALDDLSLTFNAGHLTALMGPSGAGKSTLGNLLIGLNEPTSGSVQVSGMSPAQLTKITPGIISFVPQNPGILSATIAENIAIGVPLEEIDDDRLQESIEFAGLADFVKSLPEGATSTLGKSGAEMSGGQLQRLGLARAIYPRPKFLLLDEATSALDADTEALISQKVSELRGLTTVVIIAHRLSTIREADVIHVLDHGKLCGSGTLQELKRDNSMVERYIKLMRVT